MSDDRHFHILETLRKRICFAPPAEVVMLSEVDLTREFNVSRTPIRQVLQRLAYERLVVIRTGVGTMALPLENTERKSHVAVFQGLCDVAAQIETSSFTTSEIAKLRSLRVYVKGSEPLIVGDAFEMWATLLEVMIGRCDDPVLCDALAASYWRVMRWCANGFLTMDAAGRDYLTQFFKTLFQTAEAGKTGIFPHMRQMDLALFLPSKKAKS